MSTTPASLDRLLTPAELRTWLAERGFPLSEASIYRGLKKGELPGRRVGGRWVIPMPALERWMGLAVGEPEPVAPTAVAPIPFLARRKVA